MENDSTLRIDLEAIDGRRIGQFNFSGTGTDSANDADPANYEINNGAINISTMVPGTPIKVRGFATAFGHAPQIADFVDELSEHLNENAAVRHIVAVGNSMMPYRL
ncbi:MAG: hypothetical protein WBM69_29825 [Desulfobacterales bacterium]